MRWRVGGTNTNLSCYNKVRAQIVQVLVERIMRYVELNRTVEAHSECILFIYLLDANGSPVPNVKMKIWAGPPPAGRPPYYEDESQEGLNRRTDSGGKFQFIVANPTPTQPLDFFVQAIDEVGAPLNDPVHYAFPPHEARWVLVTMRAVAPSSASTGEERSNTGLQIDRKAASVATVNTSPAPETHSTVSNLPSTYKTILENPLPPKSPPRQKLFAHYLLLGSGSQPGTLTNLIIALDYIIRFAPIVGFSPDEAKFAERVTLVGDNSALSSTIEQSLKEAGCNVARLSAPDSYALEDVFKQLIESGSPYPSL